MNVRVSAATNRDLRHLLAEGAFREDLFYRLNVIHLMVPSLRERRADIPALIQHFLARSDQLGTRPKSVENDALSALVEYAWPGNVRELENVVERIVGSIAFVDGITAENQQQFRYKS